MEANIQVIFSAWRRWKRNALTNKTRSRIGHMIMVQHLWHLPENRVVIHSRPQFPRKID